MTASEKRRLERMPLSKEALLMKDAVLFEAKLADYHEEGAGAFASVSFSPGQKAVLYAELPFEPERESFYGEVRWCERTDGDGDLPYRIGLRFIQ